MERHTRARPVRVLVVAAYPAVEAGLGALLTREGSGLTVSTPGTVAALSGSNTDPDVIVADLAGLIGESADDLGLRHPQAALVLLGADPTSDGPGLGGGPVAYLSPNVDGAALIAAVQSVYLGLSVVDPALLDVGENLPWPQPRPRPADAADDTLTPRERQVLTLVADGLPNKAIARELGISEHTVKFHVGSLLSKLGAGSRTEAVTLATRRGLLAV